MSASSTPELSPHTRARRLSARRGSIAAVDPWGMHNDVNMNPSRSTTSRLTIVRVPQVEVEEPRRLHRRHGSNASINSTTSTKSDGAPVGRLSFAFSSFSGQVGAQGAGAGSGRPVSPSSSPRMRPSSPGASRFASTLPNHSKLSPEQIVDIARTSVNPRSPLPSPHGPLSATAPAFNPISFTPLPDSIYLPFIDRPAEVVALIQSQPSARLFALLQQTFPPDERAPMGSKYEVPKTSSDPKEWAFADLEYWLKMVDRDIADDTLWVLKARRCIMTHSELIWERVKGALGVPPELDVEDEGPEPPVLREPPPTSESLDSNVFEPDSPVVSGQPLSESQLDEDDIVIEPVFANQNPPATSTEPSGGLGSSLGDLREEDETEGAEEKGQEEQEVQGLRITTSPSFHAFVPEHVLSGASSVPSGSPVARFASPAGTNDKDLPYDILRERGPGHPLFPSNFAQLSLSPTLRPSKRTLSMSGYPPKPAYLNAQTVGSGLYRTSSIDAGTGRAAVAARPEWARSWDPSKHEYAVTTGSTGSD